MKTKEKKADSKFLIFEVGNVDYGIQAIDIREIVRYEPIQKLSKLPSFILGITSIRGEKIAVIDMSILLGNTKTITRTSKSCYIVALVTSGSKQVSVCLMIDSLREVVKISDDNINTTPTVAGHEQAPHLLGLGRIKNGNCLLLNMEKLLQNCCETNNNDEKSHSFDSILDISNDKVSKSNKKNIVIQKLITVWVGCYKFAIPVTTIKQILDNSAEKIDGEHPDFLHDIRKIDGRPVGIMEISQLVSQDDNQVDVDVVGESTIQPDLTDLRRDSEGSNAGLVDIQKYEQQEGLIVVQFKDTLVGLLVDKIGTAYNVEVSTLKSNAFCEQFSRGKIRCLGLMEDNGESIEVIDPMVFLDDSEVIQLQKWSHSVERLFSMGRDKDSHLKNVVKLDSSKQHLVGSYLLMQVADCVIAIRNSQVKEVTQYKSIVDIPNTSEELIGLLDIRGAAYPVLDLAYKFELTRETDNVDTQCIVLY
ncbi:hypothetical protein MNBD_GAMMA12-2363 [hydrothermal vent metagenome]|uniref:CheW-like domain-containing protein n=1 Tax=hydrothermal vent metagenome TaxID=652676 RepID=A0A3B0Y322_9ZZZZ